MNTYSSSGLRRATAWAASLLCLTSVWAIDPDLPYSSTSTGADGALTFRRIIPGGLQHVDMAYDPGAGKVILFGGNGPSGVSSDTWEWSGGDWVRLSPATTPPARYGHRMVYDAARQEIVMFGGYRNGQLGDTWVFKNGNWTEKQPATVPPSRTTRTWCMMRIRIGRRCSWWAASGPMNGLGFGMAPIGVSFHPPLIRPTTIALASPTIPFVRRS